MPGRGQAVKDFMCFFLQTSATFTNTKDGERALKSAAAPVPVRFEDGKWSEPESWNTPTKKKKKEAGVGWVEEEEEAEEEGDGEVWVKFVYTAPERRGGGEEWED